MLREEGNMFRRVTLKTFLGTRQLVIDPGDSAVPALYDSVIADNCQPTDEELRRTVRMHILGMMHEVDEFSWNEVETEADAFTVGWQAARQAKS